MLVKIIEVNKCSGSRYWYRNHIGQQFFVTPIYGGFMVATSGQVAGVIEAEDCTVLGDADVPAGVLLRTAQCVEFLSLEPVAQELVLCA